MYQRICQDIDIGGYMSKYIRILAEKSKTERHELIEEFLNEYGLFGVQEATEVQFKEFIDKKGLVES